MPEQSNKTERHRTALFLSRIQSKKGLPLLIEAWSQVRPAGWHMRVIGPDEDGHRTELEALVRSANLQDQWTFGGPLEGAAKWQAFRDAELFILPTHSENFGIAVAEALASGLPVITTQGAPWSGLRSHGCGWWTGISAAEIATALEEACNMNPEGLRAMGDRGREWVRRDFNWNGIARHMVSAYSEVLKDGVGGSQKIALKG